MKKSFNAMPKIKICNQCNLQVAEYINLCPNCGNTNFVEPLYNNQLRRKKGIKGWQIALIILIIVSILALFFLIVLRPVLIEYVKSQMTCREMGAPLP